MHLDKQLTIAIDGHSSCGKSTVAKALAKVLGYTYVDSGAMYRAVTLFCIENGLASAENIKEEELMAQMSNINISFKRTHPADEAETYLNGKNVEREIRSMAVSNLASPVSTLGFVREAMVKQQREMSQKGGVVMDGRDIGTVVFPNADLKIFMTAEPEIRAQRRYDELKAKGIPAKMQEIMDNIKNRDHIDSTRAISPLKKAEDAIVLNNSDLTRQEQLNWILELIKERF